MYENPYGGDSPYDDDPTTARRRAILGLMDRNEPSRTTLTQPHQVPGSVAYDPSSLPQSERDTSEPSTPTNPYGGTQPQSSAAEPAPIPTDPHLGSQLLDYYGEGVNRRGGYGGSDPKRQAIAGALVSSGNPYAMAAGAVGYLDAWLHRHADTAPTDFSEADATAIVRSAAPEILGRPMSDEDIHQGWVNLGLKPGDRWVGQGGVQYMLQQLYDSPEAQQFRAHGGASAASSTSGTAPGAGSAGTAPSSGATPAGAAATGGGGGMPSTLEGFDAGKFADPNKHDVKYDFARLAAGAPPTPAGLDSIWDQIRQQFPEAVRVDQDEIDFDGPGPGGPVDVIRGAGAGGQAWHFEPVGGAESGAASEAPASSTTSLPSTPGAAQLAAPLTNNNVLQQIMDEVRRIQSGQPPRNAILQQMGLA